MLVKKPNPIKKKFRIDDLAIHRDLQARYYALNKDHVEDLKRIRDAEAARGKKTVIDPPKVIMVEGKPFVYDGHHTIAMEKDRKTEFLTCEVVEGTWEDAILLAAAANNSIVGLKRSNVDKRRAVELALSVLPKSTSAEEVAAHIGDVSGQFVRNIKKELRQDEIEQKEKETGKPQPTETEEAEAEPEKASGPMAGAAATTANGKPEKPAKAPKAGSTKIDKRRITEPLGRLAKELMAVAKNTGTDGSPEFQGFVRTMNELETGIVAWIVKLNKAK